MLRHTVRCTRCREFAIFISIGRRVALGDGLSISIAA
jgi:hypothetical protein